jgi:hypothetical protein
MWLVNWRLVDETKDKKTKRRVSLCLRVSLTVRLSRRRLDRDAVSVARSGESGACSQQFRDKKEVEARPPCSSLRCITVGWSTLVRGPRYIPFLDRPLHSPSQFPFFTRLQWLISRYCPKYTSLYPPLRKSAVDATKRGPVQAEFHSFSRQPHAKAEMRK